MAETYDRMPTAEGSHTLEVDLTWADLRRFMSYHTLHEPLSRTVMIVGYVGWIAYWTYSTCTLDMSQRGDGSLAKTLPAVYTLLTAIVAAVAGILWYHLFLWGMTSRIFRQSVGGVGAGTVTISPAGVTRSWPTGETRVDWSAVRQILDTRKDVYFFLSRIHAFAIPRRCFPSAAAADAFVQAAREWRARSRL
jgi:hypothetical protein